MDLFTQAVQQNHDHIAVHTWSRQSLPSTPHLARADDPSADPYMTTLTDQQVVGELGWTMQIIYDHSGLLPAWWRPPYGDVDARVRAIAKHVFGLTTVIWNHDTNDVRSLNHPLALSALAEEERELQWCLDDNSGQGSACPAAPGNPANFAALMTELQTFYALPKSPGLLILEHELAKRAVQGFITIWPTIKANGWIPAAIPDLFGCNLLPHCLSVMREAYGGWAAPHGTRTLRMG